MTYKKIKITTKLKKSIFLKACDYCLDLSKVVLAGIVLASIMGIEINKLYLIAAGAIVTVFLGIMGFVFYILGHQNS